MEVIPGHEVVNLCACPGDNLIYRCTVYGDVNGATIWNGTAFNGCALDEILLLHRHFTPTEGPTGICNNRDIVGQSLGIQGNNYTSQLNVTITPSTAGKTITCAYDALTIDQTNDMIYFSTILPGTCTRKIITSFSTSLFSHTLWFTLNYCRSTATTK